MSSWSQPSIVVPVSVLHEANAARSGNENHVSECFSSPAGVQCRRNALTATKIDVVKKVAPSSNKYAQLQQSVIYNTSRLPPSSRSRRCTLATSCLMYRVSHPVVQLYIDFEFALRRSCCRACSMGPCRFSDGDVFI